MKVSEISKKARTISGDDLMSDAAKVMAKEGIGCLIIAKGDSVEGIITERDVLKEVADDTANMGLPVRKFMSTKIVSVDYDSEIDDAATLMRKHRIKKLPVMKKGKLTGIITSTDLVANAEDFNEFSFF